MMIITFCINYKNNDFHIHIVA